MMNKEILVSITTLNNADWQKQILDLKQLGIKRFALFVSAANPVLRQEIYKELKSELGGCIIPFCHARSDMTKEEFDFLINEFKTERFNFHPLRSIPIQPSPEINRFFDKIYIENEGMGVQTTDCDGFAGLCVDTAHLEQAKREKPESYANTLELIKRHKIGANHISSILSKRRFDPNANEERWDWHTFSDFSELDYLKTFPKEYFGRYIAIEFSNNIATQIEIKDYLQKVILQPDIETDID
jgi:hypothetical protein